MAGSRRNRAARLAAAAGLAVSASVFAGDLHPPMGPIEPTMVSLKAVEPREVLVSFASSPDAVHVITRAAHIVMTEDLVVPQGKSGIVVALPPGTEGGVTIDMNGFSILGQPGSLHGVHFTATFTNGRYVLRAGVPVRISNMGGSGVVVDGAATVDIDGITVHDCAGNGVQISSTDTARLSVDVESCVGNGIQATQTKQLLYTAKAGKTGSASGKRGGISKIGQHGLLAVGCDNIVLSGFEASDCGLDGARCVGAGQVIEIVSLVVDGCGGDGLHTEGASSVSVSDSSVSHAGGDGFSIRSSGYDGSHRLTRGRAVRCVGDGVQVTGDTDSDGVLEISSMTCVGNGGSGVHLDWAAGMGGGGGGGGSIRVSSTVCSDNGADGMRINRDRSKSMDMTVREFEAARNAGSGLKSYFETGDKPTQPQFAAFIDSFVSNNGGHGFEIEDSRLSVRGCESSGNHADGWNLLRTPPSPGHKFVDTLSLRSTNNGRHGLHIVSGSVRLSGCDLSGNGFGSPTGGDGLHASGLTNLFVTGSSCSENASSGADLDGVSSMCSMESVTCSSNGLHGVHARSAIGLPAGRMHATGVLCDGNGSHGIYLEATTGGTVSRCASSNNGGVGIIVLGFEHVAENNVCIGNSGGSLVVPVPGNSVGPLVDEVGMSTNTNPSSNRVR